jgi:site-specific recombinase XerD
MPVFGPITGPLVALLAGADEGPKEKHVALTVEGAPWGQYGLDRAFVRVRDRAGFSGWSIYSLRHWAITRWLRLGIPVHVVQRMAGHRHLSTTQHYVHLVGADLTQAARLMG